MQFVRFGWWVAVVCLIAGFSTSCKKKDPSRLDHSKWIARNHVCARETLAELKTSVQEKAQEAQELLEELQKHLLAHQCPNGKHPDCIPAAGIQALTTLISSAAVPTEDETTASSDANTDPQSASTQPDTEPEDQEAVHDSLDTIAVDTAKRLKAKGNFQEPKPKTTNTALPMDAPLADREPGPLEIARKAGCGMEVPPECTLLTQDTVVSKLALFVEQVAQLESKVQRFLESAGTRLEDKPIGALFESIKTLELQIHELVSREELATRRKGRDLAFFEAMKPDVIKGIISDLSLAVPKQIISNLNDLVPYIEKAVKFYNDHSSEWTQKLQAVTRNFQKFQRVHANVCLTRPNCWQFRQCIKRYELPGILMLEENR